MISGNTIKHSSWRLVPLLLLLMAACSDESMDTGHTVATEVAETETSRLNVWMDEKYQQALHFYPWRKAYYGIKDEDYGLIGDLSEQGLDQALQWRRNATAQMQTEFRYAELTPDGRDSYDLWVFLTDQEVAARRYWSNNYVFTQNSFSMQRRLPLLLVAWHQVETLQDAQDYIARIRAAGQAIEQLIVRARIYADQGVRPPYFAFDIVARETRNVIGGYPFEQVENDNPIWADFSSEVEALSRAGLIDAETAEQLRAQGQRALLESWKPAHEALLDWLEEDRGHAADTARGVGSLPDGQNFYRERLAYHTTTDLTPDEVHEIGLENVARLHREIEAVMAEVGYAGTLQEFFTLLRDSKEDPRFYFPNNDSGRQAYLDQSTAFLDNIKSQLPALFGLLPKADLVVRRVEAFREQAGAAQHYNPSSADGSRPGVYYAHLIDMTTMPRYQLEDVAYHEGLPGHHMQFAIAGELTSVPEFRKRNYITAYNEGWGLYAEGLAKELPGTFEDPYSEVGRLSGELWRAVRLVVDTGLHAQGWTEQAAIDYMIDNSMNTEGQSISEIRRYLANPGQATAYMIGMLRFRELRSQAEQTLGDRFDIRAFHDVVLGSGPLPFALLERKVNAWTDAWTDELR